MDKICDAHYFTIPSQGNVYTLIELQTMSGSNKILAASLRRKIYLFDYFLNNDGYLKPSVKEIHFTYIPSGAEIISMDAFNKSDTSNDFIIGITIIKQQCETYFNIYSENEPSLEFNIDQIAQNCFMLDLDFIPNHLYHTKLYTDPASQISEVVWLLSGGDSKIHMYCEDKPNHCYREVEMENAFPELNNVSSIVMWMDIKYCQNNTRRVSAYGSQCGLVRFFLVSVDPLEILKTWSFRSEGPVSGVRLFSLNPPDDPNPLIINDQIKISKNENNEIKKFDEEEKINLLVTNTLEDSVVYMDVLTQGLKQEISLIGSNNYDSILCSLVGDIDLDRQNEIILGSYGQELLMYKYENKKWNLKSQREFGNPIHSLRYLDVTGDGVRELIALTLKGVHIMQHDLDYVQETFNELFKNIHTTFNNDKPDPS